MIDWDSGHSFTALLKSENGEVLAEGKAMVSEGIQDINFTSDFVPLFPIGTPMQIVRLNNGREIHKFTGKTYISDKTLIRLIGVEDCIIDDYSALYCNHLELTATLEELVANNEKAPRRFFKRKQEQEYIPLMFKAPIVALSDKKVIFLYDNTNPFYEGQAFIIKINPPVLLPQTIIKAERALLFGDTASYLCDFVNLTEESKQYIRNWLLDYSLKHPESM